MCLQYRSLFSSHISKLQCERVYYLVFTRAIMEVTSSVIKITNIRTTNYNRCSETNSRTAASGITCIHYTIKSQIVSAKRVTYIDVLEPEKDNLFLLMSHISAQNDGSAGDRQDIWELNHVRPIWHSVRSKLNDHMEWKQIAFSSWDRSRTTVHLECSIPRHLKPLLPRRLRQFQNHHKWEYYCLNPVGTWWNHSLNPVTVPVASTVSIYSNFWREWTLLSSNIHQSFTM